MDVPEAPPPPPPPPPNRTFTGHGYCKRCSSPRPNARFGFRCALLHMQPRVLADWQSAADDAPECCPPPPPHPPERGAPGILCCRSLTGSSLWRRKSAPGSAERPTGHPIRCAVRTVCTYVLPYSRTPVPSVLYSVRTIRTKIRIVWASMTLYDHPVGSGFPGLSFHPTTTSPAAVSPLADLFLRPRCFSIAAAAVAGGWASALVLHIEDGTGPPPPSLSRDHLPSSPFLSTWSSRSRLDGTSSGLPISVDHVGHSPPTAEGGNARDLFGSVGRESKRPRPGECAVTLRT